VTKEAEMVPTKKASEVVALLDLKPHVEGGFYAETFRDSSISLSTHQLPPQYKVDRPVSTAIYFLLPAGSISRLHRIPCAETWHFYMGEPLTVFELHDDGHIELTVLGLNLDAGHRPQYTVPPNVWFGSFPTLDVESFATDGSILVKSKKRDPEVHYSLVGCTCAPGFQFEDFEMGSKDDLKAIVPKAEPFLNYLA
jgi:predicted cupin superfamily sugar epimerase